MLWRGRHNINCKHRCTEIPTLFCLVGIAYTQPGTKKHIASTVLLITNRMTQMANWMTCNNCTIEDAFSEMMILQINSKYIGGKYKAICGQTENRGKNERSVGPINPCKLFTQLSLL